MTFFKGTYAFIKISSADAFDYTYSTEVRNGEKSAQCIDFYYYITDASNNVKISVLWDDGMTKQQIAQVILFIIRNKSLVFFTNLRIDSSILNEI
jgi:hypothetical protein